MLERLSCSLSSLSCSNSNESFFTFDIVFPAASVGCNPSSKMHPPHVRTPSNSVLDYCYKQFGLQKSFEKCIVTRMGQEIIVQQEETIQSLRAYIKFLETKNTDMRLKLYTVKEMLDHH